MRRAIWMFIRDKIFRIPESMRAPKWLIWIRFVLFPIHAIRCWPSADPRYEPWNDIFVIFGQRYSGDLFREWAGMPIGSMFRLVDRNPIALERLARSFVFIDLKNGSGGFMIPESEDSKELIEEILKDPKYIVRKEEEKI